MTATEHFQRLHLIERHAHEEARVARMSIERMPGTHSDLAMVLDAFIAEAELISWAEDTSSLIEHLQAASAELDKLYAPKEIEA